MTEMRSAMVLAWAVASAAGVGACGRDRDAASAPAPLEFTGTWIGDTLPAASGTGRLARLEVRADTQAMLSIEFIGRGTVVKGGYWRARGFELTLQPVRAGGRPNEPPLVWRLDSTRLMPLRWNKEIYGEAGLLLHRWQPPVPAAPADSATGGGP